MRLIAMALFTSLLSLIPVAQEKEVHLTTSQAVDYARAIARDEGYDVTHSGIYTFDLLTGDCGAPVVRGYVALGFDILGSSRNMIVINLRTGQTLDYTTCEVFDFPDLKPFRDSVRDITGAKLMTPEELAKQVGCGKLEVLKTPVPVVPLDTKPGAGKP